MSNVPRFCVVVGANGSGKSTLFDVFGFLRDCLTFNVTRALRTRGGFHEVVSRGADGENLSIEMQYRMPITGRERLVTYGLEIGLEGKSPCIVREVLRYKRGAHGSPFHFLDFSNGVGEAVTNEEDFDKTDEELTKERQDLGQRDILAVKGLGQFQRFRGGQRTASVDRKLARLGFSRQYGPRRQGGGWGRRAPLGHGGQPPTGRKKPS